MARSITWPILVALLLMTASALAGTDDSKGAGVAKPAIERASGEQCVEETEYMRKNHMNLLKHQRDKTVHQGIRDKKHSLKNCIECHAGKTHNRVVGSNENFCQSCHSYTAVKIDCFECHASKPKATTNSPHGRGTPTTLLNTQPASKAP